MSAVRAMQAGDAESVAALYLRILKRSAKAPSPALIRYLDSFYRNGPFRDPDIPSLVHTTDGRVTGFVGVTSAPLLWGERKLRAAFCGSLMVESPAASPLAGAGLLKAFLSGPQDVSVSETANALAQGMWERLRGQVLGQNSLEWVRVLRPTGFGLAMSARSGALLRAAAPFSRAADRLAQRRSPKANLVQFVPDPAALSARAVEADEFVSLTDQFSQSYAVRADWGGGYGAHVVIEALDKPEFGAPVAAAVTPRSGGAPLGAFLYHAKPGGIARVLQVFAAPNRMGAVLQCLFADALARGAVGLRGRSDPGILQAAAGRSMAFATVSATVVQTRDPALLQVMQSGGALLNGLGGETWSRLFGGALS